MLCVNAVTNGTNPTDSSQIAVCTDSITGRVRSGRTCNSLGAFSLPMRLSAATCSRQLLETASASVSAEFRMFDGDTFPSCLLSIE